MLMNRRELAIQLTSVALSYAIRAVKCSLAKYTPIKDAEYGRQNTGTSPSGLDFGAEQGCWIHGKVNMRKHRAGQ